MNPKFRLFFRIAIIFIVLLLMIQPYNSYCNITSKCEPLSFSSLIPKREGKIEAKISFGIKNYIEGLEIKTQQVSLVTVSGRKNIINYTVKNNGKKFVRFRVQPFFNPEDLDHAIKIYHCPCGGQKKVKGGEEVTLKMEFSISDYGISRLKGIEEAKQNKIENEENQDFILLKDGVIGLEFIRY